MTTKRKAGRQTISEDGEVMKARNIRMTDAQWEYIRSMGGSEFVRRMCGPAPQGFMRGYNSAMKNPLLELHVSGKKS